MHSPTFADVVSMGSLPVALCPAGLLNMVPAGSDTTGTVAGMQKFLGVMQNYLPATGADATMTQQMSSGVVDALSSMASMMGGVVTGNPTTSMAGMLKLVNSMSDLMSLAKTASAGTATTGTADTGSTGASTSAATTDTGSAGATGATSTDTGATTIITTSTDTGSMSGSR